MLRILLRKGEAVAQISIQRERETEEGGRGEGGRVERGGRRRI